MHSEYYSTHSHVFARVHITPRSQGVLVGIFILLLSESAMGLNNSTE